MNKEYTILHISDLHKSEEDSYDDLFESMRKDSETYVQLGISLPKIIVVSGDIVEGAKDDDETPDDTIRKQYADAKVFLTSLCDTPYFLHLSFKQMILSDISKRSKNKKYKDVAKLKSIMTHK